MTAERKPKFALETVWIREYARTYLPTEAGFEFAPALLRRAGMTLLDVIHGFKFGVVISAEKLDEPGAFWVVRSECCDGQMIYLSIVVISEEVSVRLCDIRRLSPLGGLGHDAA